MSAFHQTIVVHGYIRVIEQKYNINIPKEINELIYLYQVFSDTWDKKLSHSDLVIDDTALSVKWKKQNATTAFGSNVIQIPSVGICRWKLRIKTIVDSLWVACPYIGIIQSNNDLQITEYADRGAWDHNGCQLCAGNSGLHSDNAAFESVDYPGNLEWRTVGDVLEMILDLSNKTLRFVLNDKDYGIAFSDIENGSYRLALTNMTYERNKENIFECELL